MQRQFTRLMLFALTVLCFQFTADTCRADDAEELARHCVRYVDHVVDRCTNAVADTTLECAREIRYLLEQGEVEAARRVARDCIGHIQNITDTCIEVIEHVCTRCVNVLINEYGAEEVAARVRHYCAGAIEDLVTLERRAIHFIRVQFA